MKKFSKKPYEMIRQKVASGKVAGADETGVNVSGKNNWLWAFQNGVATYLAFDNSRSHGAITDNFTPKELGGKVWVTDRWPAYFMGNVRKKVDEMILMDYIPEQIVGVCRKQGIKMVSHETIYQYIWWDKAHGDELYKHLRHRGRRHKKRGVLRKKRGTIPNRIDISERPKIVDRKNRVGDYEVDTIVGAARSQHILTLNTRELQKLQTWDSSSPGLITPGSVEPMRTPTGSSVSISPRAPTSRTSRRSSSKKWSANWTRDRERDTVSSHRIRYSASQPDWMQGCLCKLQLSWLERVNELSFKFSAHHHKLRN
ncbi:MAG: IS30 family transposase [Bacteroidales bacterium]|nr:IS30 family transposase [Bacteroidales bacterium]